MIKKILFIILAFQLFITNFAYSAEGPKFVCEGLPGCTNGDVLDKNVGLDFVVRVIAEFMQIVAVVALFALIFSGVMYLISSGDEEKIKKAQKWIIYSLIGVFISVSAWGIINLINNFRISNI